MFRYFRRQSVSASIEGEPESLSRNRDRHVTRSSGWLVGQLLPWAYFTVARYPAARLAIGAVFTPVLAKHSKSFSLIDCISVGVDRMRRNSEPMRKQVEAWQRSDLSDATAKVVMYEGFVEGKLEVPTSPAQRVTSTSSRDTKHSGHERSGVSRMHHIGVQGTRSHPATQSDSEAGRVLGGWVLASCLRKHGGADGTADPYYYSLCVRSWLEAAAPYPR